MFFPLFQVLLTTPPAPENLYAELVLVQDGGDIDRYVYTQAGDGLGSFFGNIFKSAVPFIKGAIKAAGALLNLIL